MASTLNPFGFQPYEHPSGEIRNSTYTIAANYAGVIYTNDPVNLTATGTLQLATSDGTRNGTVAGIGVLGTFQGCQYRDATGLLVQTPYWPGAVTGATEIVAWVAGAQDPSVQFQVVFANPSAGTSIQAYIGQQCDWRQNQSPAGSTATGISASYLTAVQSTAGQFQITGYAGNPQDLPTDAYVTVMVRINEGQMVAPVNAPA
jgi:hypothetical protein